MYIRNRSFPFTCLSLPRCLTRKVNSGRTQRACQPRALMSRWNFTERPTRFCFSILPHDPNDLVFILKSCVSRSSAAISQATIRYFWSWQKRTAFPRNCVAAANTHLSLSKINMFRILAINIYSNDLLVTCKFTFREKEAWIVFDFISSPTLMVLIYDITI